MPRLALRIHVSEPWTFERENESADLTGWTADHRYFDKEDWIVHLDKPFTIDEEVFEEMRISPRYLGEDFRHVVENSLVNLTVNMVPHGRRWSNIDERPLAMVGLVAQGFPTEPRTEQ
jgi:hypothetical protein